MSCRSDWTKVSDAMTKAGPPSCLRSNDTLALLLKYLVIQTSFSPSRAHYWLSLQSQQRGASQRKEDPRDPPPGACPFPPWTKLPRELQSVGCTCLSGSAPSTAVSVPLCPHSRIQARAHLRCAVLRLPICTELPALGGSPCLRSAATSTSQLKAV